MFGKMISAVLIFCNINFCKFYDAKLRNTDIIKKIDQNKINNIKKIPNPNFSQFTFTTNFAASRVFN